MGKARAEKKKEETAAGGAIAADAIVDGATQKKTTAAGSFIPRLPGEAEPAWAVATLFPPQGYWSESEYLALPTNHPVELTDGVLEVLPLPTRLHQDILAFLYKALDAFVLRGKLGKVYFASLPVHLRPDKYRVPDLIFVRQDNTKALEGKHLRGADLVMEVVSPDNPERDWVEKRQDYAEARIPEYWVVDPEQRIITVFTLSGEEYAVHGESGPGERATSRLLPDFSVAVDEVFADDDPAS